MMAANKAFTLVIDPGHGGKDTGAAGAFSKEKDINLTVAWPSESMLSAIVPR